MPEDNLIPINRIQRPQVLVAHSSLQDCDGVLLRIVVLECGHIIVRAPKWRSTHAIHVMSAPNYLSERRINHVVLYPNE